MISESTDGPYWPRVLLNTLPKKKLSKEFHWDQIGILRVEGKATAMLAPNTLICPGREYRSALPDDLPWRDAATGALLDPTDAELLSDQRLFLLNEYLEKLRTTIAADLPQSDAKAHILKQVEEFSNSCLSSRDNSREELSRYDTRPVSAFGVSESSFFRQPIYSALASTFRLEKTSNTFTSLLRFRSELAGGTQLVGAILVDETMSARFGRSPSKVSVWGEESLARLVGKAPALARVRDETQSRGYMLVEPQDLFTPLICKIEGKLGGVDARISEHGESAADFLLPITPLALCLLEPAEIPGRLSITKLKDGYEVRLDVELEDSKGEIVPHSISKKYRKAEVRQCMTPAALSIWPDFEHPEWRMYSMLLAYSDIGIRPRFTFSLSSASIYISKDRRKAVSQVQRAHELSKTLTMGELRYELRGAAEIHLMDDAPEAVVCSTGDDTDGILAGVILLPKRRKEPPLNAKWDIGIDFGTTNTTVCVSKSGSAPMPLTFSGDRISRPFELLDDKNLHTGEFIPLHDIMMPFMTILRERDPAPSDGADDTPMWKSRIYYAGDMIDALDRIGDPREPLRFAPKWSSAHQDIGRVRRYLTQVVTQCLAEAADEGIRLENIGWRFGFPEAWDNVSRGTFRRSVSGAVSAALVAATGKPPPEERSLAIVAKPESLCTAQYFRHEKQTAFVGTVVTMDIGGRTTDVSIWQNNVALWSHSVELAGRDLFIRYFMAHRTVLQHVGGADKQTWKTCIEHLDRFSGSDEDHLNAVEVIINGGLLDDGLRQGRLADLEGQPDGRGLRNIAQLGLGGLLYYFGRQIRHLHDGGIFEGDGDVPLTLCLGGRASLLFKRLFWSEGEGSDSALTAALRLLSEGTMVDGQALIKEDTKIVFTDHPKEEVARGILANSLSRADEVGEGQLPRSTHVIVGERVSSGGLDNAQSDVGSLDESEDWKVDSDLPELTSFLQALQKIANLRIDVPRKRDDSSRQKKSDRKAATGDDPWRLPDDLKMEVVDELNELLFARREKWLAATEAFEEGDSLSPARTSMIGPVFVAGLRELVLKVAARKAVIIQE